MGLSNKKEATFKISPSDPKLPISALDLPWQAPDVISGSCPKHIGVRLNRLTDQDYLCPKGGEHYSPRGSINNQTNRDNYYLGIILKGPGVMPTRGKV